MTMRDVLRTLASGLLLVILLVLWLVVCLLAQPIAFAVVAADRLGWIDVFPLHDDREHPPGDLAVVVALVLFPLFGPAHLVADWLERRLAG